MFENYKMKVLSIILVVLFFQLKSISQVEEADTIATISNRITKKKPVKYTMVKGGYGKEAKVEEKKEETSAKISYFEGGYGFNQKKNDSIHKLEMEFEKNKLDEEKLKKEYESIEKVSYFTNFEKLENRQSEESRNKNIEEAQAKLLNKLPVLDKPFHIYKKVLDPETQEIIEIYDFSNEQYVWDKNSSNEEDKLKEKILRELKYELRLQEIKKEAKKEGDK